jgi:metallo-beta-lactamase family protein
MTSAELRSLVGDETSEKIDDLLTVEAPLVVIPRGGASEVGRSCYHVQTPDFDLLIDCGLKQGGGGQFPDFRGIDQGQIDGVILTHAHIDHSGVQR